ncbi:MAG TPA: hypothetical protein VHL53_06155 [Acidimicrobiia bacterium]|nr:hypothetical protein [Acidimicrobiia bacterium]
MTDHDVPAAAGGTPGLIRAACIVLLVVGFGSVMFTVAGVADPAGARCSVARRWVDDANTDKKPWNNVDTGGRKAKELTCDDAIRLAGTIKTKEKGTKTLSIPGESAVRIQALLSVLFSLGQGISGAIVLRTLSRQARVAAIAFSLPMAFLGPLGPISLAVFVFVVYALAMSAPAKAIWPRTTGATS